MNSSSPAAVIVLAAGAGTRMKSSLPKVLHTIGGRSLVGHALDAAVNLNPEHLVAVVRHERERVVEHLLAHNHNLIIADQDEIPGTGRAVELGLEAIGSVSGTVVVTYGDVPLLTPETLSALVAEHQNAGNSVTVLSANVPDATGYGRIVRDENGLVTQIVEHKDALQIAEETGDSTLVDITEINSGIYAFDGEMLARSLVEVTTDNVQGEKYLTDVLGLAREAGGRVATYVTDDLMEVEGVNDRVQLATLGAELNRRIAERWMRSGVTIIDPSTTWIDVDVELAQDVTIKPNTQLHGNTTVATGSTIGPDTTLNDVEVGENATVRRTEATQAIIGPESNVGPFTYIRPGTVLGERGKIGAFYETKNVNIGRGAKLSHLGYVGDADIGENSNIGCGNITANYDGVNKHRTVIGAEVRTGSNTVFTAPVEIGDGAYTAAGAIVRKNVPPGALSMNAMDQRIIEDWVLERRAGSAAAEAAQKARDKS
ncbi:bifunctional UDP-N-acetylglucosamine pyrophosphorylase/glucosamine-1-phosphate N-acetyltransferase [Enteractinococcus coprophilus]|uniref:Bifunctional protein GlmU n=1 Tax=Enteractinococcus coprophilus TaxID=1027633 RepID=A0A543AFA5_9MICC|nr:bifunctional UDP-N-acetylglucosamine pyrophosphorylase/glucosamine-1-phosphate N-acetyltransferase [Enteractinococcus coprophilus]